MTTTATNTVAITKVIIQIKFFLSIIVPLNVTVIYTNYVYLVNLNNKKTHYFLLPVLRERNARYGSIGHLRCFDLLIKNTV